VTEACRLWTIDHANGALESWTTQTRDGSIAITQDDKEAPETQLVEESLVAVWER
jgi:hypothetical protein